MSLSSVRSTCPSQVEFVPAIMDSIQGREESLRPLSGSFLRTECVNPAWQPSTISLSPLLARGCSLGWARKCFHTQLPSCPLASSTHVHIRRAQLPGPAYFHPYIYSPDLFQMQISNRSCGSGTDKYQWFIPHNNGGLSEIRFVMKEGTARENA